MRIGVIGAGAIGGTIAALLDRSGHHVQATARGKHLAAIRESGLALTGAWGDHLARVEAAETLWERPEFAFVCTKAQNAKAAISENRERLDGTPVVVVQNGLTGLDEAAGLLPGSDCVGALALYAASFLAPGAVRVTTAGPSYLGVGSAAPTDAVLRATAILAGAMPASATTNFVGCQWTKLIVNQVNAMPAITGMSAQDTIAHAGLRRIITAGMREAVRVGLAGGIRFGSIQGLSHGTLRAFAAAPVALGQVLPALMAHRMGAAPNPGSTLQSIRRGRKSEIDYLNGAIVAAAADAGGEAPVNAGLVALVHEVERTGVFLSPAQIVARLGAA